MAAIVEAPPRRALGALTAWTAGIALVLYALQQSLRLPSGYGVEDWLGWKRVDSINAVVEAWCRGDTAFQWHVAAAYLLADQALFVPLYLALGVVVAWRLHGALSRGHSRLGGVTRWLLVPGVFVLLVIFVGIDSTENLGGLMRLGVHPAAFVCAALAAPAIWVAIVAWRFGAALGLRRTTSVAFALAAVLAVAALWLGMAGGAACAEPDAIAGYTARAHAWKLDLEAPIAAVLIFAALVWLFGGEFDNTTQAALRHDRATLRGMCGGIVGRSRYVLALMALYALLVLFFDQCRDVLLALVDMRDAEARWQRLATLVVAALACGLYAHACWTWSRLAGMVQRSGLVLPKDTALLDAAGEFARGFSRALSVVPLALTCLLGATTMGDLVHAAGNGGFAVGGRTSLVHVAVGAALLVGFAAVSLGTAWLLIVLRRQHRLPSLRAYYNSEGDVHALVWYQALAQQQRHAPLPAWQDRIVLLTRPVWLPLVALAALAVLRWTLALAPGTLAAAPPTLVIVTLSLTWWLGVLGLLSLWEQRHAVPWVVLPLLWVGVLDAYELADNHVLTPALSPATSPADVPTLLAAASVHGAAAITVLMACAAVAWGAGVVSPQRWLRTWPVASRWLVALGGLAGGYFVLVGVDRLTPPAALPQMPPPQTLPQALVQRLNEAPKQGELYLVAAEGGGIRSAYWTAQVLAELHVLVPDFAQRSLVFSGVSGGSLGHAVVRACQRSVQDASRGLAAGAQPQALRDCIDAGFATFDPLSPLLAGLLFDDVLARMLPLSAGDSVLRCRRPGCGHVARAGAFEREWLRGFARLVEPLVLPRAGDAAAPQPPGGPLLALNSTWVESGNRTVAASAALSADGFPAAVMLDHCIGGDVGLAAAAHTSARFPFTNPLARIPARDSPACRGNGHLIDGGYFDNSGVTTLIDVQQALVALPNEDAGRRTLALLVRNGQRSRECYLRAGGPERSCILRDVKLRTEPTDLDAAVPRGRLGLYADLFGPAAALVNVAGVGSHGRHPAAELRAELAEVGQPCGRSRVQLIDQIDDGSLVPLGWYLSPAARDALRRAAGEAVGATCRTTGS